MSIIISTSITKEQQKFLEETKMSPSGLLQAAIQKQIDEISAPIELLKEANRKVQVWKEINEKMKAFIDKHGLMDAYLKEQDV